MSELNELADKLKSEGEKFSALFADLTDAQWMSNVYTEGETWTIRNVLADLVLEHEGSVGTCDMDEISLGKSVDTILELGSRQARGELDVGLCRRTRKREMVFDRVRKALGGAEEHEEELACPVVEVGRPLERERLGRRRTFSAAEVPHAPLAHILSLMPSAQVPA